MIGLSLIDNTIKECVYDSKGDHWLIPRVMLRTKIPSKNGRIFPQTFFKFSYTKGFQ